eukprot:TRINITY_DN7652_c0_g1_i1.p1 TRINITY_DN7652_c0_g1~~TRINITY_DN7652_c0_g1_i1.p1  ORF type:complete len:1123 (+),score=256.91 TRINITY_DN7652_c0_g1_i1:28-3369(+)
MDGGAEEAVEVRLPPDVVARIARIVNALHSKGKTKDERYVSLLRILQKQAPFDQATFSAESHPITPSQRQQLSRQIALFKYMCQNTPIPPAILESVRCYGWGNRATELKWPLQKTPMQTIPSPIEITALIEERDTAVAKLMATRQAELEVTKGLSEQAKLQAMIEIKAIKLLDRQRRTRIMVMEEMKKVQQAEASGYKAVMMLRKQTRVESKARVEAEAKLKSIHVAFLYSVDEHAKKFREFHKARRAVTRRCNMQVVAYLANKDRDVAREQERLERERLRALKADDEEAYLRLLQQSKNERLIRLIQQTDEFLSTLGDRIKATKMDVIAEEEDDFNVAALGDSLNDELRQAFVNSKQKYYRLAHTINETIPHQPTILTGGQLRDFQMVGLAWMVSLYNNNLNGILADEMGLGKTIQTISLLAYLMEFKQNNGPHLVIVPLATMSNWLSEFEAWCPKLQVIAYYGPKDTRKILSGALLEDMTYNVVLTTYEFVIGDKAKLGRIPWNYIILDEGQRIKNKDSKLSGTLTGAYDSKHRLVLTGTPLQNDLTELWSLLNFLLPTIFQTANDFTNWFDAPFITGEDTAPVTEEEGMLLIHRLHQVLRPFLLRRVKKEVASQLPEKREIVLRCDLSKWQKAIYEQINQGIVSNIGDMQLRKICNHPYLFDVAVPIQTNEELIRASGKFELMDRMLPKFFKTGHRVLIFCQMTKLMDIMEEYMRYRGYKYVRIDGSVSGAIRKERLDDFNRPGSDLFVFLLSTGAGGVGLNLQTADTVILFDSDWNPQKDIQAQDRVHRIGQTKEVRVFRFVTTSDMEYKILEKSQAKLRTDALVIQAGKFNTQSTINERNRMIMEHIAHDFERLARDLPNDDEMNELLSRSDDELTYFKQVDKEIDAMREARWRAQGGIGEYTRLMGTHEFSQSWLLQVHAKAEFFAPNPNTLGRGKRARAQSRLSESDGPGPVTPLTIDSHGSSRSGKVIDLIDDEDEYVSVGEADEDALEDDSDDSSNKRARKRTGKRPSESTKKVPRKRIRAASNSGDQETDIMPMRDEWPHTDDDGRSENTSAIATPSASAFDADGTLNIDDVMDTTTPSATTPTAVTEAADAIHSMENVDIDG